MLRNLGYNGFRSFYNTFAYILHKKRVKDRLVVSKKKSIFGRIFE